MPFHHLGKIIGLPNDWSIQVWDLAFWRNSHF